MSADARRGEVDRARDVNGRAGILLQRSDKIAHQIVFRRSMSAAERLGRRARIHSWAFDRLSAWLLRHLSFDIHLAGGLTPAAAPVFDKAFGTIERVPDHIGVARNHLAAQD